MKTEILKVNCPTCQHEVIWTEASPYRPFCSERCRIIDLGEWASETRTIAGSREDLMTEEMELEMRLQELANNRQ